MPTDSTARIDPGTPVIIGVALAAQDADAAPDPASNADAITLMARALTDAAADAGAPGVLEEIDLVAVVAGLWHHRDPGRMVADELGLSPRSTLLSTFGGQTPIALASHLSELIAQGDIQVAVMLGGEATATRHRLRELGLGYPERVEPTEPAPSWGTELDMGDELARSRDAEQPRNSYAVIDSALRAKRGETLDKARDRAAAMWAGYAAVAASNPNAVDRSEPDPATIRDPGPGNRMVSWPYTKAMCANNQVDHGAAVIVCSNAAADRLGVPTDRRVHPHFCVTAEDAARLLTREHLAETPGLLAAGDTLARELGDAGPLDHVDLYGCFPSIVALTAEILGLDPTGQLTQTGGLGFAGAAINNAAGESLVAMIHTLRADPGSLGMVQGNGGHATKHALGVYSTEPPAIPYRTIECGTYEGTHPLAAADAAGEVWIDGVTVSFDRDGPEKAIVACRFDDGSRTWANSDDPEVMAAFMADEWVGRRARVDGPTITL